MSERYWENTDGSLNEVGQWMRQNLIIPVIEISKEELLKRYPKREESMSEPSRMATPEEMAGLKIAKATLLDCPVYKDDLERVKAKIKRKDFQNALSMQLNRFMNYRRIEAADIHRATGISFSTMSEWINNKVACQMLDDNIKKLARYLDCSIDFLVYATPVTDRDLELDDVMPTLDEPHKEDHANY